jgi:hypothetical protein
VKYKFSFLLSTPNSVPPSLHILSLQKNGQGQESPGLCESVRPLSFSILAHRFSLVDFLMGGVSAVR